MAQLNDDVAEVVERPKKPKANGKGSYRSEHWYYPCMEGTGKRVPWDKLAKFYHMLERFENPAFQRNNLRSCFYKTEGSKIAEIQDKWEKDFLGRVIICRQDTVIIQGKAEHLTFIPLFYKGQKLVLQCLERTDSRTYAKPEDCIVITDQLKANEQRNAEVWKYRSKGNSVKRLPEIWCESASNKDESAS
jgi:hypothetical protein